MKRAVAIMTLCLAMLAALPARADAQTQHEILAEAVAQAFTLRTAVDQGGAAALPFYFGSYADATLTSPPGSADGQASFYNLGIAETALFTPPGGCTPEEQQKRAQQAVEDVTSFVRDTAIPTVLKGDVPVLEIPTLPCSERLPGFAQSRYPATATIQESSQQDLLGTALCGANACPAAEALALTGNVLQGGHFVAKATGAPSQTSDASIVGINIPGVLTIGSARSFAQATIEKERMILRSTWTAADVCIAPDLTGCALAIGSIRQSAVIVRDATGKILTRTARTVIAGVEGGGQNTEITTADLGPGLPPIELSAPDNRGSLRIRAVSATGGCGDPGKPDVADAGGIEIFGKGSGTGVSLPLPLLGTASGGGLTLGGACVSGRISEVSFELPGGGGDSGGGNLPGTGVVVPPGTAGPPVGGGPILSGPRVVRKSVVHYETRGAPAWRTAPYWASILGALILSGILMFVFRRSRYVAPVTAALDRFTRQFIRG
ncbi:MAG: hypothetical protein WAT66_05705 [Actinomycetota bacterium]